MSMLRLKPEGYALFDTAIGRCGIAWTERGVCGVQIPEGEEASTRGRLLRRWPDTPEETPPPGVADVIEKIVALMEGGADRVRRLPARPARHERVRAPRLFRGAGNPARTDSHLRRDRRADRRRRCGTGSGTGARRQPRADRGAVPSGGRRERQERRVLGARRCQDQAANAGDRAQRLRHARRPVALEARDGPRASRPWSRQPPAARAGCRRLRRSRTRPSGGAGGADAGATPPRHPPRPRRARAPRPRRRLLVRTFRNVAAHRRRDEGRQSTTDGIVGRRLLTRLARRLAVTEVARAAVVAVVAIVVVARRPVALSALGLRLPALVAVAALIALSVAAILLVTVLRTAILLAVPVAAIVPIIAPIAVVVGAILVAVVVLLPVGLRLPIALREARLRLVLPVEVLPRLVGLLLAAVCVGRRSGCPW